MDISREARNRMYHNYSRLSSNYYAILGYTLVAATKASTSLGPSRKSLLDSGYSFFVRLLCGANC